MTRIGTRIGTRIATRIGLTYDAPSDEERALTAHALEAIGAVLFLEANDSLPAQLQQQRPDIVLNLARGSDAPARRVHVPAFLEYFDIPYIGSDTVTHATCVERPRMKQALEPPASRRHECPARISHGLAEGIESIAIRAFFALNCRDVARVDIRLDDRGVPNVCAVDPLPSFAPGSAGGVVLPASRAAGLDDDEMVQRCLLLASDRVGLDVPKAPVFSPLRRRTPPGGTRVR